MSQDSRHTSRAPHGHRRMARSGRPRRWPPAQQSAITRPGVRTQSARLVGAASRMYSSCGVHLRALLLGGGVAWWAWSSNYFCRQCVPRLPATWRRVGARAATSAVGRVGRGGMAARRGGGADGGDGGGLRLWSRRPRTGLAHCICSAATGGVSCWGCSGSWERMLGGGEAPAFLSACAHEHYRAYRCSVRSDSASVCHLIGVRARHGAAHGGWRC